MRYKIPAVFLDRDGTLLNERGYLSDPRRLRFYPTAIQGLRCLSQAGFPLIILTNQSGLARGYFTLHTLQKINAQLKKILGRRGIRIQGIYFCPHLPDAGCPCRKPKGLMARRAARDLNLDLKKSFVVGDQTSDMRLAHGIGATGILVLTGAGLSFWKRAAPWTQKRTQNLATAAEWILKRTGRCDF